MTVWMLDGDEAVVDEKRSEVGDGDLVVRHAADGLIEIGVVASEGGDPVDWRAEVDLALLPGRDQLTPGSGGEGLRRIEDHGELETALNGVLTAERDRGA